MDIAVLLVVGVMGILGCVVLVIVGLMWKPSGRTDKPKAAPKVTGEAAAPAPRLTTEAGAREVLRVWRDAQSEELLVELGGQRFARMADIHLPEMRTGLLTTLRDLEAFTAGAATAPLVVMPNVAAKPLPPVTMTDVGAAKLAATGTAPLVAPSMNPFKQMLVLRDLRKIPEPTVKSITEQIDEILQEKLNGTPQAQRGIRVFSGPKGNALFRTDGQDYDAVDSVPDNDVRTLIRAAVAEWESKQ